MTKEVRIEDQLAYVRQRIADTPASDWKKVAKDAQVSHRSLYLLKHDYFDPRYSTVLRLYGVLKRNEKPKRRAKVAA